MFNRSVTALTLAARTANTIYSPDIENGGGRSAIVVIDITVRAGGSPTAAFTIEGLDSASGKYYTILESVSSLGAVATTILRIGPGLTAATNLVANDLLPPVFRVKCVITSAGAITATVGVAMIG